MDYVVKINSLGFEKYFFISTFAALLEEVFKKTYKIYANNFTISTNRKSQNNQEE